MLTNAALLEHLGLLQRIENGKHLLGDNTKKQITYLYGDALLMNFHTALYDKILHQITQLCNQEYVETLLSAQECIFIQKGHFHQLMHQLQAIYTQFYGGFLQAMQVANGVKRVNGDPVKGGFQTHEQFSMKCYKSVNRLMMRAFCLSGYINELNALEFPTDYNHMCCILQKYWEFRSLWELLSVHEPSRMAALFKKSTRSISDVVVLLHFTTDGTLRLRAVSCCQ
jgi:hypothetical protein